MTERIKIFEPHSPGCYLAQKGRQEFIVHPRTGGYDFGRKKNGHKGGSTLWHVFVCNNISCAGRVGVRWDALMEFISGELLAAGGELATDLPAAPETAQTSRENPATTATEMRDNCTCEAGSRRERFAPVADPLRRVDPRLATNLPKEKA